MQIMDLFEEREIYERQLAWLRNMVSFTTDDVMAFWAMPFMDAYDVGLLAQCKGICGAMNDIGVRYVG